MEPASKPFLKKIYEECYRGWAKEAATLPSGKKIELGSGQGFSKNFIPDLLTADILAGPGIDLVLDAMKMPFEDEEISGFFMMNVLHHVSDPLKLFREITRCLKPGGRVLIWDQYPGFPAYFIYRFLHHEVFDKNAKEWKFKSENPQMDANGALAWIVFYRDRARFETLFPDLKIKRLIRHTPLRYWLSGGLREVSLVPVWSFGILSKLDQFLARLWPGFGSFVSIELEKR